MTGIFNSSNNISSKNQVTFNSVTKIIKLIDNSELSVYNIGGELVLSSNKQYTSLSHLSKGIYIVKAGTNSQKILIN